MYVIVKNIPSYVTVDDLKNSIFPAVKGGLFQAKGHIEAIKLIQLTDNRGKALERHALVRLNSDQIKKRLVKVKSLNLRSMAKAVFFDDGKVVLDSSVKEYVIRHWNNDRRTNRYTRSSSVNKRLADRRRRGLTVITLSEK